MIVKVCGMREADNIRAVEALGADWIGMIFHPESPRFVQMVPTHAGIIPDRAGVQADAAPATAGQPRQRAKRVGVFVDDMAQNIITRVVNYELDFVQLHGHESPTLIRNLRRTLCAADGQGRAIAPGLGFIKAISVASRDDVRQWEQYADCVDYLLFDTRSPLPGGSGEQFDWSLLEAYDGPLPFLLSGGIGPGDAERVRQFRHPRLAGIDLNSRFETAPAVKDVELLRAFLAAL